MEEREGPEGEGERGERGDSNSLDLATVDMAILMGQLTR